MADDLANSVDLNTNGDVVPLGVGEFNTQPAPSPIEKKQTSDLEKILAKLNASLELASKRQQAAVKARKTLEKQENQRFAKIAIAMANGRLGKANSEVENLRRQIRDIERTNAIRDMLAKDLQEQQRRNSLAIEREESEAEKRHMDWAKHDEEVAQSMQDFTDKMSEASDKLANKVSEAYAPIKELTENNELILGDLSKEFGAVSSFISNSWQKMQTVAGAFSKVANWSAGFSLFSNKEKAKENQNEESNEISNSKNEIKENKNSSEEDNYNKDISLKEAVEELKESDRINSEEIISENKHSLDKNERKAERAEKKNLSPIRRGVNAIRTSMLLNTLLTLSKFSLLVALPSAIAELVDDVRKIWDHRQEIWDYIVKPLITEIGHAVWSVGLDIKEGANSIIAAIGDWAASKFDTLAASRADVLAKDIDVKSFNSINATTDKDKASKNNLLNTLKRHKQEADELAKTAADLKSKLNPTDEDWAALFTRYSNLKSRISSELRDDPQARSWFIDRHDALKYDFKPHVLPGNVILAGGLNEIEAKLTATNLAAVGGAKGKEIQVREVGASSYFNINEGYPDASGVVHTGRDIADELVKAGQGGGADGYYDVLRKYYASDGKTLYEHTNAETNAPGFPLGGDSKAVDNLRKSKAAEFFSNNKTIDTIKFGNSVYERPRVVPNPSEDKKDPPKVKDKGPLASAEGSKSSNVYNSNNVYNMGSSTEAISIAPVALS